jgi:hypothetical protein
VGQVQFQGSPKSSVKADTITAGPVFCRAFVHGNFFCENNIKNILWQERKHNGGLLINEEVERDNKIKGKNLKGRAGYSSIQDSGKDNLRGKGGKFKKKKGLSDTSGVNEVN